MTCTWLWSRNYWKKAKPLIAHREQIRQFFDRLAPSYSRRYRPSDNPWLAYWFGARLEQALKFLPAGKACVLDVGCGIGTAYERLQDMKFQGEYYGCDISLEMLAQSNIPAERQINASPEDEAFPALQADLILALGVTSYWPTPELKTLLQAMANHLAPNGRLVLSCTDPSGLDYRLRCRLQPLLRAVGVRRKAVAHPIYAYSRDDLAAILPDSLYITDQQFLPATFPLLAPFFPSLNLRFSRLISLPPLSFFRTDFLLVLEIS